MSTENQDFVEAIEENIMKIYSFLDENKQENTYYIHFKNVEINKKGFATVYSTSMINAKTNF